MNIEYIVYNNQLIIKDKNADENSMKIPNINFYFMVITVFDNCIKQWFWYNVEAANIIDDINNIIEKDLLFSVQINLKFCNQMSSKFIYYLRNNLFHEFNTQYKNGYRVLITRGKNIIKSTTGTFIKLAIHNKDILDLTKFIQNGIITPETQAQEKKLIEDHHKFLKEKITLEKDQNELLDKKGEIMGIMKRRKDEIDEMKKMTQIIEDEKSKLLQIYKKDKEEKREIDDMVRQEEFEKLMAKKEKDDENKKRLMAEKDRLISESRKNIKEKNDKLIKDIKERYQKEILISQDNAERSKQLLNDLELERVRLEKVVSNRDLDNPEDKKVIEENRKREFKERANEYLQKRAEQFFDNLNKKYVKAKEDKNLTDKTSKLLEEHQKIQKQLYQERLQEELTQFISHEKEQNKLIDILNKKRDEINKKVESSNSKELKSVVNEMDKYFQEKQNYFNTNIEQHLTVIKNNINRKIDSIDSRKRTLNYVEQLNKQKIMWIKLLQNQVKQYKNDQQIIDQYLQELDKKYRDEALSAVKIFKDNVNSIINEDKIKKDITNILKFRDERKNLLKQYNEEYTELKRLENNYSKNKKEYVDTMQQIVKEWSDKKSEEYNKKREEEIELFEKRRVKYLKSCEEALQFNFDRFVNKCEEIRDKSAFGKVEHFVQKESDEKIKQLAKEEIEKQQKQWEELNNEKIRLDNILKEQKKLQLEGIERRKKEEQEMRREMKKMKLEEERKRIRAERASRKKGLNKSLRIW